MEVITAFIDWAIRIHWIWIFLSGILGGGAVMYALLRKFLLPKEMFKLQEEIREFKEQSSNTEESDLGYSVLSWWDPPNNILDGISGNKKNYPRIIHVNKTGELREFPDPRKTPF